MGQEHGRRHRTPVPKESEVFVTRSQNPGLLPGELPLDMKYVDYFQGYFFAVWTGVAMATGAEIPIEERPASEVTSFTGTRVVPEGVPVRNPSFDVTPAGLVTAIITEVGIARTPYESSLAAMAAHVR